MILYDLFESFDSLPFFIQVEYDGLHFLFESSVIPYGFLDKKLIDYSIHNNTLYCALL